MNSTQVADVQVADVHEWMNAEAAMRAERDAALAEVQRLREALTPSAETKAAYSGEFVFHTTFVDEDGDDVLVEHTVPWTTIKEIMAAIRARALVSPP